MKVVNFFLKNYNKILIILAIIIFFTIYLRTLNFGFVNDDFDLVNNSWSEAIETFLYGVHFRPLWYLSFPLINHFFGPNAFIHHLFNLILHLANLIIAYYVFKKLVNSEKALFIIFFWTFFPQISFQISWISNRNDLLMTFFLLLSFNLAVNNKLNSSLIVYLLAFLSKVTCLFYPLVYLTKFGFGYSKKIKIISFLIFLLVFLISYLALQNGELQSHMAELSYPIRIFNHIKNFMMGWFILIFPLPFFENIFVAFIYLIFISTSFFVILKTFIIEKSSILFLLICFTLSIPLSINYELRTTYVLSLFVVATLISFIDIKKLNLLSYNKQIKIVIFLSFLIYGVFTSILVTNNFKSDQFNIYGNEHRVDNFYLNNFYSEFRLFQIKLLNKIVN
jgi:hypothetical protein